MICSNSKNHDLWPKPTYEKGDAEPHFFFIITPPYSGSTAIAMLLNTSDRVSVLHKKAEGQWLIPGLCQEDRWHHNKFVDYQSVKAVWLHQYQRNCPKSQRQKSNVVIEKSPPSMVRIMQLASHFESVSFVANNRDAYAHCASILYRQHNADELSPEQRKKVLTYKVGDWLERSYLIRDLVSENNIPLITYESFCKNPSESIMKMTSLPSDVVKSIRIDSVVEVKDYKPQRVINQNERQILKLTIDELGFLSDVLSEHSSLIDFFGYKINSY